MTFNDIYNQFVKSTKENFPVDVHIKRIIDREYDGELPEWANSKYAGLFQQYIFYYELNHNHID